MKQKIPMTAKERNGEKGAAMVMALLISFLFLVASAGLILEASMNSQNVTDLVAEQQAYHAAESGIQSAVHILRCQKNTNPGCGDVRANPLIDTSKAATDSANQIDYKKAINVATSNIDADAAKSFRLSRWVNYTSTCESTADPCVPLGDANYKYSLQVTDPDNVSRFVSFSISGKLYDYDTGDTTQKTYDRDASNNVTSNKLIIKYTAPAAVVDQDMSGGNMSIPYGKFTITQVGGGQIVQTNNRFEITLRMTRPYNAVKTFRGWIRATTDPNSVPQIIFDSQTLTLVGSALTLNLSATPSVGWSSVVTIPPPDPMVNGYLIGYQAQPTGSSAGFDNIIGGTISPPEPTRLLITSTGYGPRGAKKQLQAIIQKNFFNGLTAPAALTLVGPFSTSSPASQFYFSAGQSGALEYSGVDLATGSTDIIPPVGTSNDAALGCVEDYLSGNPCPGTIANGTNPFNGTITGSPSNVSTEMPYWLETPTQLDSEIHRLAETARTSNRFYASGTAPTDWGNATTGGGITFCDGDVELGQGISGDGGGILVVTGTLTLRGSFTFNGLIIVTGQGGILRSGGGDGIIQGNVVVAPYQNSRIEDNLDPAIDSTFLAPHFDMDGGGTSTLQFNSQSLANGLTAVSNFVLGVMEK